MGLNIYDFTKRNKWINFKRKIKNASPAEQEIVEYLELLEKQINLVAAYIRQVEFERAKASLFDDEDDIK